MTEAQTGKIGDISEAGQSGGLLSHVDNILRAEPRIGMMNQLRSALLRYANSIPNPDPTPGIDIDPPDTTYELNRHLISELLKRADSFDHIFLTAQNGSVYFVKGGEVLSFKSGGIDERLCSTPFVDAADTIRGGKYNSFAVSQIFFLSEEQKRVLYEEYVGDEFFTNFIKDTDGKLRTTSVGRGVYPLEFGTNVRIQQVGYTPPDDPRSYEQEKGYILKGLDDQGDYIRFVPGRLQPGGFIDEYHIGHPIELVVK